MPGISYSSLSSSLSAQNKYHPICKAVSLLLFLLLVSSFLLLFPISLLDRVLLDLKCCAVCQSPKKCAAAVFESRPLLRKISVELSAHIKISQIHNNNNIFLFYCLPLLSLAFFHLLFFITFFKIVCRRLTLTCGKGSD